MTYALMSGAIGMGCWVIGLFFFLYWRKASERLFGIFALSFWILGLERLAPIVTQLGDERHAFQYMIRLVAFLLILCAIVDKNWGSKAGVSTFTGKSKEKT